MLPSTHTCPLRLALFWPYMRASPENRMVSVSWAEPSKASSVWALVGPPWHPPCRVCTCRGQPIRGCVQKFNCQSCFQRIFQDCSGDCSENRQRFCRDGSKIFKCFKDISETVHTFSRIRQRCFRDFPEMFQRCFRDKLKIVQGCFSFFAIFKYFQRPPARPKGQREPCVRTLTGKTGSDKHPE